MKKVNILLVLALLFITGVMILVMVQGVSLTERRIVEWSSVPSVEEGTRKVTDSFFPILSQWNKVNFKGENSVTEVIYQSFKKRGSEIKPQTQVTLNSLGEVKDMFEIEVVIPQREREVQRCKSGIKEGCVSVKALNKFEKKVRDKEFTWMSLYRISESKVLFLVIPKS